MTRGFYTLTSSMLTENRVLNTISNNMGNVNTTGFKKDTITTTTFKDQIIYRIGNLDKSHMEKLGSSSTIRTVDKAVTNYIQGPLEETGRELDFAVNGDGFFNINTDKGVVYTRNGSFNLDNEGYLYLQPYGRVMGEKGEIKLNTDKITVDITGMIYADGKAVDRIRLTAFDNNNELIKSGEGTFTNVNQANELPMGDAKQGAVLWKSIERANVNTMQEMVDMMSSQRTLQSSSQVLKMYDQLLGRIVSEIGRV